MHGFSGFTSLALISGNSVHQVHRGVRQSDGAAVILKVLDTLATSLEDLARLRHEYQLLSQMPQPGLVRALDLLREDNLVSLVLADDQAEDLASVLNREKFPLPAALQLMLAATRAVARMHQNDVIHRDINPANLILLPDRVTLKLIDFGIAIQRLNGLREEGQTVALAGSLRYIAPEQTGKMNRQVDYRADYYALGVTFYELLLGRPPFDSLDAHELIHAHIARRPVPPAELDPGVPVMLSNLIMKLLAKNAEQRYQSAHGLEVDLQCCLDILQRDGMEALRTANWKLGEQDRASQLSIPEKLYGREAELQVLFRGFAKVRQGRKQLFLVGGHSGVGKSALVRELHKPVLDSNGFLVFGKFDQLQRDIPYRGLVLALQQWTRQLLSVTEDELKRWRLRLQKAVEGNGGLLVELIPELDMLLEQQPVPQRMDPIQQQQLFNHVVLNFLGAIASAAHPLVVVLDDLQWADAGSLHLMELLLTSDDITHLMLVGIYRDSETDASHPLLLTMESLRRRGAVPDTIALAPLGLDAVQQLLQDTFGASPEDNQALARVILDKTQGNPFYLEEFLSSLVKEKLIEFDFAAGVWRWDPARLQESTATVNVVNLLVQRVQTLTPDALHVLQIAACAGFEFVLTDLLAVAPYPAATVIDALQQAVKQNLIQPVGDAYLADAAEPDLDMLRKSRLSYRFIHDRVHQAVYDSIAADQLPPLHQRMGQRLYDSLNETEREAQIFDIVRHFNAAVSLLVRADEIRLHLAINLLAADKAIESGGFENAFRLLQGGSTLLNDILWRDDYDFVLGFCNKLIQAAYLCERYDEMERCIVQLEQQVSERIHMMPAFHTQMQALNRQGRAQDAVDLGISVAHLVGEKIKRHPNRLDVMLKLAGAKWFLWRRLRGQRLQDIPLTEANHSAFQLASHDHQFQIAELSFLARPNVFACIVFDGVRKTFETGVSRTTPGAFAAFGLLHCGLLNQIEVGVDYSRFALRAAEMVGDPYILVATTQLYNGFVRHWVEPLRETLKSLLWVQRHSTEIARLDFSCHGANVYLANAWFSGSDLDELAVEAEKFGKLAHRYGYGNLALYPELTRQLCLNMQGLASEPGLLQGAAFDETRFDVAAQARIDPALLLYFHVFKLQLHFFLGEYQQALEHALAGHRHLASAPGAYMISQLYLYEGLAALCLFQQDSGYERQAIKAISRALRKHRFWARHCSENFSNKCHLLKGAALQVQGKLLAAMQHYELAAAGARREGFVQERGVACELASQCAQQLNLPVAADDYLHEAAVQFQKWGAKEIVNRLRQMPIVRQREAGENTSLSGTTRTLGNSTLDIASLRKALKDISEEKVHTRLIAKTILAAAEFAGSQNATLLLERDNELRIEAQLTAEMDVPVIMQSLPLEDDMELLATPVVHYVSRTLTSVVISDAQQLQEQIPGLNKVRCVLARQVRSIMALPLLEGVETERKLIGMIYLENNLTSDAFTTGMIEALEIIGLAAAGRLELSRKAVTDGLTGLFNHDFFQQQLAEQFRLASRYQRNLGLILLDIDHFKKFNDTWGHQVGDIVLRQVADTIRRCCRASDVVARYGGEEMVVILPETDEASALNVAEKIRAAIEAVAIFHEGQELRVTSSLGVCAYSDGTSHTKDMVRQADEALYACKAAGRNCVSSLNHPPQR